MDSGALRGPFFHALAQGLDRGLPLWHHMGVDESPHAMNIVTRAQAQAQGLTRYFTGKPCKNGHVCERLVNGGCAECRVAIKRENYRRHRAVPTDQLLKTCCICGVQFQARTRNQNICGEGCRLAKKTRQAAQWKQANRERVSELNRAAYQDPIKGAKIRERLQRYTEANREVCEQRWKENTQRRIETGEHQALCGKRRRRIEVNTPAMTAAEKAKLAQFYRVARLLAKRYGVPFDVDHIIPLSRGGAHHPSNLQILTASENRKKSAKLPSGLAA